MGSRSLQFSGMKEFLQQKLHNPNRPLLDGFKKEFSPYEMSCNGNGKYTGIHVLDFLICNVVSPFPIFISVRCKPYQHLLGGGNSHGMMPNGN